MHVCVYVFQSKTSIELFRIEKHKDRSKKLFVFYHQGHFILLKFLFYQVCEKDLYCMEWAVKMMQKVCNVFRTSSEKNIFLQSVENAFAQIIMDALQLVISGKKSITIITP